MHCIVQNQAFSLFIYFCIKSIILLLFIRIILLFAENVILSYEWFYSTTQQKSSDYKSAIKIKEIFTCCVIIP